MRERNRHEKKRKRGERMREGEKEIYNIERGNKFYQESERERQTERKRRVSL
jgi:hypothetical protein